MSSQDFTDDDAHNSVPNIIPFPTKHTEAIPFLKKHADDIDTDALAYLRDQFDIQACRDPLERILQTRLLHLSARLDKSARAEAEGPGDIAWHRYEAQADRSFRSTMTLLLRLRSQSAQHERNLARAKRRTNSDETDDSDANPPTESSADTAPPVEPPCPPDWRERLIIDPAIQAEWPVVRGTTLWADHVAAMIEDGWTLASMLREYPKLSPGDVAACRHADSIGLCGPWPDGVAPPPRCHANLPHPRPGPGTFPFPDSHSPPTAS